MDHRDAGPGSRTREAENGEAAWEEFVERHAGTIFRVVRVFAGSYDDRMDLFVYVCDHLREDGMRRVRAFEYRAETPCSFSTYLTVVVKNLAVDFVRAAEGRYRPFRNLADLHLTERLIFEYHLRDGGSLEDARRRLHERHGIRITPAQAARSARRLAARLSPSQRWRLTARLQSRSSPVPIDPVDGSAVDSHATPLSSGADDPERRLLTQAAECALQAALGSIAPHKQLALTLRYRDGLPVKKVATIMRVSERQVERWSGEGLRVLRSRLQSRGVSRSELDAADLSVIWRSPELEPGP